MLCFAFNCYINQQTQIYRWNEGASAYIAPWPHSLYLPDLCNQPWLLQGNFSEFINSGKFSVLLKITENKLSEVIKNCSGSIPL